MGRKGKLRGSRLCQVNLRESKGLWRLAKCSEPEQGCLPDICRVNRTSLREAISKQWRGYGRPERNPEHGATRHRHVVTRLFPPLYYGIIPGQAAETLAERGGRKRAGRGNPNNPAGREGAARNEKNCTRERVLCFILFSLPSLSLPLPRIFPYGSRKPYEAVMI
jgi:hypothetical protein